MCRSPLTCRGEQFTLKFLDIDERSRSATSGSGEEVPGEALGRCLQNCIRAGLGHFANTSVNEGTRARGLALTFSCREDCGRCTVRPLRGGAFWDYAKTLGRSSKKGASFAVALNCGIGSSSLNAEVKAFAKLHRVQGANSSYCGLK